MSPLFNAQSVLKADYKPDSLPSNKDFLTTTIQMAWPATLEAILGSLVGFFDIMMVGSLGSFAIAAVGLTNQPKFICLATFFAINLAVSAVIARRKGAEKQDEANQTLLQSIILVCILAIIISLLAIFFADPILRFAGSQENTHEQSVVYFKIIIAGLILHTLTLVINAAQRGVGKTKISMKSNVSMSLTNVLFNYLLINGNLGFPALGVKGAAIATVIGFLVGFLMSLSSILKKDGYLYLFYNTNTLKRRHGIYSSLYKVGIGSFVEQIFLRIGFLLFALIVANLGTEAFAAHQIGLTILTISFSIGDGLSVASISLVGQSLGKKRADMAKVYGAFCQHIGIICAIIIAIVFITFGDVIYMLFSNEAIVIEYGATIMKIIAVTVVLQISQVIFNGCLRGAGDTKYTAMVSFITITFIRPFLAWVFIYPVGIGLAGAWLSLLTDQAMRFILTRQRFRSGKWQEIDV